MEKYNTKRQKLIDGYKEIKQSLGYKEAMNKIKIESEQLEKKIDKQVGEYLKKRVEDANHTKEDEETYSYYLLCQAQKRSEEEIMKGESE